MEKETSVLSRTGVAPALMNGVAWNAPTAPTWNLSVPSESALERRHYAILQAAATIIAGSPSEGMTIGAAVVHAMTMLELIESEVEQREQKRDEALKELDQIYGAGETARAQ